MSVVAQAQPSEDFCTCGRQGSGAWVGCDSGACPVEWYHWECVGVTEEPVSDWICPRCTFSTGTKTPSSKTRTIAKKYSRCLWKRPNTVFFENIIAESRAVALAQKDEGKAENETGKWDSRTQSLESGEDVLLRQMRATLSREKVEKANTESAFNDLEEGPSNCISCGTLDESRGLGNFEAAMDIDDGIQARMLMSVFPISALRSTLPRLEG